MKSYVTALLLTVMILFYGSVFASTQDKQGQILQQKLILLDSMINRGATSKKVRGSDNIEAKQLLLRAEELYARARDNIQQGDTSETGKIINEAMRAITSAGAKAKGKKGSTAAQRSRYHELLTVIDSLQQSVDLTFENPVDLEQINQLKEQASEHTKTDDYSKSIKDLNKAYNLIATAISDNIKNTTVVYSLDFKNSQDEYEYEHRRYHGNMELVQTMLDARSETPTRNLIVSFTIKANNTLKQAEDLALNEQHDDALRMVEQANRDLSRAMGMLGLRF